NAVRLPAPSSDSQIAVANVLMKPEGDAACSSGAAADSVGRRSVATSIVRPKTTSASMSFLNTPCDLVTLLFREIIAGSTRRLRVPRIAVNFHLFQKGGALC